MARRHGVTEFLQSFESIGSTFFDLEVDLLVVLDEKGNIERVNDAFERALDRQESEVLGQGIIHLVRMDDWAAFLNAFTAVQPAPFRLLRKDSGDVGVRLIACRFIKRRGFLVLRKVTG